MMLSIPSKICDCQSRVLWLGEDDSANVAAVGSSLCVIQQTAGIKRLCKYDGEPIAFVNGNLLTIHQGVHGIVLRLSEEKMINLPISQCTIYDSIYDSASESILLLTPESLLNVNLAARSVEIMDKWEASDFQFERVTASNTFAAAYRYGLRIYDYIKNKQLYVSHERLYSLASLGAETQIVAADEGGNVDLIEFETEHEHTHIYLNGLVLFVGWIDRHPVAVYRKDSTTHCCVVQDNSPVSTTIGSFDCETFAVVQDRHLAIGTMQGTVFFWDAANGALQYIALEGTPRIVAMLWSKKRNELFLGTRSGEVYVCHET
jgi:hypothetical protein